MGRVRVLLALLAWLVAQGAARAGEGVKVSGQVVDAGGKPVAGAEVATTWLAEGDRMRPMEEIKTDGEGRFQIALREVPQALMAIASDGRRGGVVVVRAAGETKIELVPLVRVEGRLRITDPELSLQNGRLRLLREDSDFAQCHTRTGAFTFLAPAGAYVLQAMAEDTEPVDKEITVVAGATADLGTIDLPPSAVAKSYGKAAPAVTAIQRGGEAVGLDSLKGKWVLLEFWAFW
jgi:hypothetical protein